MANKESYRKKRKNQRDINTIDIFELHYKIMKQFESEVESLHDKHQELSRLEWISKNSTTDNEKLQANENIISLKNEIYLIESGIREAQYIFETESILEKYSSLLKKPIRVSFMNNNVIDRKDRHTLIIDYINIAKHYIDIDPIETPDIILQCDSCKKELQTADELLLVCPDCGFAIKNLASVAGYQDNNRINNAQRYHYERWVHFSDSVKKYQGKQNTTIPSRVYEDIHKKIHDHDIPIERVSKDHVYEFLKLTENNDYYEDINLIFSEITGKSPPDISHLEPKLFELFDEIDTVYQEVKPPDRLNFLNGQYVLFRFLQKLRFPCDEDDFSILKTREKLLEHEYIWQQICERKQWSFTSLV
jgi:hypothetical protein